MIVHVSIPSRVSKLDKARGELFAAMPVAEDFHKEALERAAPVVEAAEATIESEKKKLGNEAGSEKLLQAHKDIGRARAAEEDASKMAQGVQKKLDRLNDTIEGYNLLTGKDPEGFVKKLTEEQHTNFAHFAKRLRAVRGSSVLSGKAKKQEVENIWGEMRKYANKCGLPVSQILAARS